MHGDELWGSGVGTGQELRLVGLKVWGENWLR